MRLPQLDSDELNRYSRHILLNEVGEEGQQKLKAAKVLCIGTGGLGSPIVMYLAAAGVGELGLVDFDVVDESNLQRQILHGSSTLGMPKVLSAQQRVQDINPHVQLHLFEEALTSHNALHLLNQYDIIIDGTDNFPTRYLINDACVLLNKPYIYGSIFKFEGQVSVFNSKGAWKRPYNWTELSPADQQQLRHQKQDWEYDHSSNGPTYRDLYPEPPAPNSVPSCAEGGVLGILPGVIGCIQATETIKLILGLGKSLSGRLLTYNALSMQFREFKLHPDPQAPVITSLIDYRQFCGFPSIDSVQQLSITTCINRLEAGWTPFVLDVRQPYETEQLSLPFVSLAHPHDSIEEVIDRLPMDNDIVVHCQRGGRSAHVCAFLSEAGFSRVFNLDGGILAWQQVSPIPKQDND